LSQRRADAVVEYLIGDGSIDKDRLQSRGVGSQQPKASNQAESGRKLNRRVELIIKRG
jgi:OOP family OmpA-OmpF porin